MPYTLRVEGGKISEVLSLVKIPSRKTAPNEVRGTRATGRESHAPTEDSPIGQWCGASHADTDTP
jgi:hypothetical protein